MEITGLIVVRLPHLNYLVEGRDRIPVLNGLYYSGVDRQRWSDVFDEDFYSKRIPEGLQRLACAVRDSSHDFTGIDLCQDIDAARNLLQYSNRKVDANELIAVRSPQLKKIKGVVNIDFSAEWMGYDFVAAGEWSLIAAGVFRDPGYYSSWIPKLNRYGLFDDPALCSDYVSAYERAVAEGKSEPIAPESAGLGKLAVQVGRVAL